MRSLKFRVYIPDHEKFSEVLLNLAAAIEPKNKYERFKLDCPKENL